MTARANNLIIDGSFENFQSMGWQSNPSLGWVQIANGHAPSLITASSYQATPPDGQFFMALQDPTSGFYQQVNGLTVGQEYQLSFWLGEWSRVFSSDYFQYGSEVGLTLTGATSYANIFTTPFTLVPYDGLHVPQPYAAGHWDFETVNFIAASSSVSIYFQDPDNIQTNRPGIDAVRLEAVSHVPDAGATLLLLGMASPVFALMHRRRRKA